MVANAGDEATDLQLEALLSGELNSLEGEHDALQLWKTLKTDSRSRHRYEAMVYALRAFSGHSSERLFNLAEADALWPVVMGQVAADAQHRSGLSKAALQHLAVPNLVASISQALTRFSTRPSDAVEEVVVDLPVTDTQSQEVNFAFTRVGGEVGLRLYREADVAADSFDVRCQLDGHELRNNVEGGDWQGVTDALAELSRVTSSLLGDDVLVNGKISIRSGRAEVRLNPLNVIRGASGA